MGWKTKLALGSHSQLSVSGHVQQDLSQQWNAMLKYSRYLLGNNTDCGQNIPKWHSFDLDLNYKLFSKIIIQVIEKYFLKKWKQKFFCFEKQNQVTVISDNFQVWLMKLDAGLALLTIYWQMKSHFWLLGPNACSDCPDLQMHWVI